MRKSPWVAAVWTLYPSSLRAVLAASSHSGEEKASRAGLSVVLTKSNLLDMAQRNLRVAGTGGAPGRTPSRRDFMRKEFIWLVDSPRSFLMLSMPRATGPRLVQ